MTGYAKKLYKEKALAESIGGAGAHIAKYNTSQSVPVKILAGMKKATERKRVKLDKDNKEGGVVAATTNAKNKREGAERLEFKKKSRRHSEREGPAPSIGFMKSGVFRVKN